MARIGKSMGMGTEDRRRGTFFERVTGAAPNFPGKLGADSHLLHGLEINGVVAPVNLDGQRGPSTRPICLFHLLTHFRFITSPFTPPLLGT